MDNTKERVINLKEDTHFIEQYVSLRNRYCDLLLTRPVNTLETKEWLKRKDAEVLGIVQGESLLGVAILYLSKNGEIAFFARDKGKGIGSKLLEIIEKTAKDKRVDSVWAWVLSDNLSAQRAFINNGYTEENKSQKNYCNEIKKGKVYRKKINYSPKGDIKRSKSK